MAQNGQVKTATVRIQRFNPDVDKKPYFDEFNVEVTPETTILDALESIKATDDGSVTFRRSCRHAICGSCAMSVNGRNTLVCNQPLRSHLDGSNKVTIRPLPYLPIIKDLVVDRSSFWEQYMRVKPWLVPPDNVPETEFRVSPEEVAALNNAEKCIMCGACYSACSVTALNKKYIGPHALLKAFLRVLDPRDSIPTERLKEVAGGDGVYRCHTIFNCIDACPKGLDPTRAIETLRGLALRRLKFEEERNGRQKTINDPVSVKAGS
ncbi:MAG: succinate dehydrogenase iron-sulfur subunit [Anaerolineales bacterium]|nr:succinate dehydrogenase iron-sulfur subunit [Anaerolineales bacterium]